MEKYVELKIHDMSTTLYPADAYALVLEEVGGERKIPIIIGHLEAQAIKVMMVKYHAPRPLTHDLFVAFAQQLEAELRIDVSTGNDPHAVLRLVGIVSQCAAAGTADDTETKFFFHIAVSCNKYVKLRTNQIYSVETFFASKKTLFIWTFFQNLFLQRNCTVKRVPSEWNPPLRDFCTVLS